MTSNEIKAELKRINDSLAELDRRTSSLERRVKILESKIEGKPKGWGILWPDPKRGGGS